MAKLTKKEQKLRKKEMQKTEKEHDHKEDVLKS